MSDVNKEMLNLTYEYFMKNRELLALKNSLKIAGNGGCIDLAFGSSYARNGIDPYCFKKLVNCSVSSMDLSYTFKLYDKLIKNEKVKVENTIIFIGYYALYVELSKMKYPANIYIRDKILTPLINDETDVGEYKNIVPYESRNSIFTEACKMQEKRKGCFNDLYGRRSMLGLEKSWQSFSEEEKELIGKQRAKRHNEFIKYKDTYEYNIDIIKKLKGLSGKINSRIIFVIPPFSKYYTKNINAGMKEELVQCLRDNNIELVDFNNIDIMDDNDFVDPDHLNGRGAYKMSSYLAYSYEI